MNYKAEQFDKPQLIQILTDKARNIYLQMQITIFPEKTDISYIVNFSGQCQYFNENEFRKALDFFYTPLRKIEQVN